MVPCHGHGVTGYRISVRHRPARGDVHDTRARPTRMVKFTLPLLAAVSGLTDGATATSGLVIGPPWRCGPVALQPHNVRPTGGCDWGRGLRSARHHRLHTELLCRQSASCCPFAAARTHPSPQIHTRPVLAPPPSVLRCRLRHDTHVSVIR